MQQQAQILFDVEQSCIINDLHLEMIYRYGMTTSTTLKNNWIYFMYIGWYGISNASYGYIVRWAVQIQRWLKVDKYLFNQVAIQ